MSPMRIIGYEPSMNTDGRLSRPASAALLVGSIVVCFGAAALGGLATASGVQSWYPSLDRPPWTPPGWVFGPVWTVLYTLMAVAAWDVARRGLRPARSALALFGVQLALNTLWSPVFFALHWLWTALFVLSALWVAVALCIRAFWRHSRVAALLLAPYLTWLTIAWTLNAWIAWFNT